MLKKCIFSPRIVPISLKGIRLGTKFHKLHLDNIRSAYSQLHKYYPECYKISQKRKEKMTPAVRINSHLNVYKFLGFKRGKKGF